jgi:mannitol/fructose-specific phosphotransferase system IIA component (Ntr-type)
VGTTLTRHPKANRHLISAAHTPGGEMQIVIGILALEYAVISPSVFVAIIVSAVLSSVLVGPWMKAALRRGRKSSPSGYLTPEMTIPQLAAKTSTEAISALCRHAGSGLDHKNLEAAVIQREEMMGTALGKNVAIPHARLHEIATPRIAFARVPEGVEWNAPDGLPAKFIFLLLTPIEENDSQIHMLRSIASAMSLTDNCNKLLTASDQDLYPLLREILQ